MYPADAQAGLLKMENFFQQIFTTPITW